MTGIGAVSGYGNLSLQTANWKDGNGVEFNTELPGRTFELYQDPTSGDIYIGYAVPEPASLALLGACGAVAAIAYRRRRRR